MQSVLFEQCEKKLSLKNRVGNSLYGKIVTYSVSVLAAEDYFNLNISYFLPDTADEVLHDLENKLKFDPDILSLGGNGMATLTGLRIRFPLNDQSIEQLPTIATNYIRYLDSANFPAFEGTKEVRRKPVFVKPKVTYGDSIYPHVENVPTYSPDTDPLIINIKEKKPVATQTFGLGSVLRGLAGSFLGASLFSIPHIISLALLLDNMLYGRYHNSKASYLFFLLTFLIAVGARLGYSLLNGDKRRMVKYPIMISVVAIVTIIATMLGSGLITASHATNLYELFDFALTSPHTIILMLFSLISNIGLCVLHLKSDKDLV